MSFENNIRTKRKKPHEAEKLANYQKMSWAVVRGEPTAAQRYLSELCRLASSDSTPAPAPPLPRLIYWTMRNHPDRTHMINGASGQSFTNAQILAAAVPLARALVARRLTGKRLLVSMRNHQQLTSLFYAALFAGASPLLLDPLSTPRELAYFLRLIEPALVLCDADRRTDVAAAVADYGALTDAEIVSHDALAQFSAGHDNDPAKFQPVQVDPEAVAVLLPTSGSTGLPKATEIQYSALLAHIPSLWLHHEQFPTPTERVMFMSTAQWMTFSNLLTACPVLGITVVMSPDKTMPTVLRILETFKPTWLLLVPGTATALSTAASSAQLSSLRTMVTTGAPPAPATMQRLRTLAPQADVLNSYGMTEAQGFAALAHRNSPQSTIGKIFNIFYYKLADDSGDEVPLGTKGELYLKSDCIIKRYVKNEEAYLECAAAGGWWRTGDVFTEDAEGNLFYVERKKFWFKYMNYQISPEELESVILSVEGVAEVATAGSESGAAAAVIVRPGHTVTRELIHKAVDKELIEYKRLRGGIAFVTSLPRTHSGKLHRGDCLKFIEQLIESGECY